MDKEIDKILEELTGGSAAMREALRLSSLGYMNNHQAALGANYDLANRAIAEQKALEDAVSLTTNNIPQEVLNSIMGTATSAASQVIEEMRSRSLLMFQRVDFAQEFLEQGRAISLFEVNNSLSERQFSAIADMLNVSAIGSAVEAANAAQLMGLPQSFNDEFKFATSLLAEQLSVFEQVQEATSGIPPDLLTSLESMLARSFVAQEALLEEYREDREERREDRKNDSNYQMRLVVIQIVINLLFFLISTTLHLQDNDQLTDISDAVRANTVAINETRDHFEAMASQLETMQAIQEKDSEQVQAANAEIVVILRDIAETLAKQTEIKLDDADDL